MPLIKFYINPDSEKYRPQISYTLMVWAKNQQCEILLVDSSNNAVTIGRGAEHMLQIGDNLVVQKELREGAAPFKPDLQSRNYLSDAFYMINSVQEFEASALDDLNRFPYESSYQYTSGTVMHNLVQDCFHAISKIAGVPARHEPSSFFLSHDIDLVYGAIVEDGFNVLKKGRIDIFLKLLFNVAVGRPDWLNMDKIMRLESEYDCRSVFFWIVNKGRVNQREINADYSFASAKVQQEFASIASAGFENGIHKSLKQESFQQEFTKYGSIPLANRYHYLKFQLPHAYHDIEDAGLKLDASLGFPAEIGFRNNYGLPFNPYNFNEGKPFSFVEAPLHIMDRTFFQYKRASPREAEKDIINFFECNRTNCVLSVLWHNNFFTNYKFKGYLDLYKKMLAYIRDNSFKTISAATIVDKYSIVP